MGLWIVEDIVFSTIFLYPLVAFVGVCDSWCLHVKDPNVGIVAVVDCMCVRVGSFASLV